MDSNGRPARDARPRLTAPITAESLLGVETEYALAAFAPDGSAFDRDAAVRLLMEAASERLVHLRGPMRMDFFLGNGSRFYLDAGNHPELATPECTDPLEVVRYIRAGERILRDLAREVERKAPGLERLCLFKTNVDYSGVETTWGCHESYLTATSPIGMADPMLPHLVSRIVYTGAGGFEPFTPGIVFCLSPRVWHLEFTYSPESTGDRGIFHMKRESLSSRGYHRLHVICGESLCSERAMWLKLGTTALVARLIDAGVNFGREVELGEPVAAMRAFASDPSCRRRVSSRKGPVSAVAIQRAYLREAEAHLDRAFMPRWAPELCGAWRETLEALERDERDDGETAIEGRLDWAMKKRLFTLFCEERGFTRERIQTWNALLDEARVLAQAEGLDERSLPDALLERNRSMGRVRHKVRAAMKSEGLTFRELRAFAELRAQLFELDMKFSEVGERALHQASSADGASHHELLDPPSVSHAMTAPPRGSRAQVRGRLVQRFAAKKDRYRCTWHTLWDMEAGRIAMFRKPFQKKELWQAARGLTVDRGDFVRFPAPDR